ncbi:hypothetical protein ACFOY4_01545 [Actinomadura syzygii]|uniref:Uncharacterized protein n=1 Tax=Actinomadura syzygii TaxID=1427538 RepID=A0A5D0TT04_9ACTN|nr:hypothetical protein [Actinomadura syzygii]TYC08570.1 hypothetical protein FXF65_37380 [Actinomadura syzygii]
MNKAHEDIVGERTIADHHVVIRCITWKGTSRRSFDILDAESHDELTDESFDECPTDEQIKDVLAGLDLVALAEGRELTPEDLDEAVHETASQRASEVNNGGLAVQIDYLIDALGPKGARSVIEDCGKRSA